MPFEIKLTATALKEMEDQVDWYDNRQDGLGTKFTQAVDNRLELLCDTPGMFPVRASGYREILIDNFPFLIVYKIIKKINTVRVYHIFHTKRNPILKK